MSELTFGVLGPVVVHGPGGPRHVGGPRARALLAMLVLDHGHVVSAARLIEGVWGADAPSGAPATLQVHMSNLRKRLGAGAVATNAPGYKLVVHEAAVDLAVFETTVHEAREARRTGDPGRAAATFRRALGLWRGDALADVREAPFSAAAVPWLEEQRALAIEERVTALVAAGDSQQAIVEAESAMRSMPHRETLWACLMLALYRTGRQADALGAFQRARHVLAEEIGVPPGPELVRLEAMILRHDPELESGSAPIGPGEGDDTALRDTFEATGRATSWLILEDETVRLLQGTTVIGRHPACEVTLDDGAVSRRHAEIRASLDRHVLVDLGSTNGTSVNGLPVIQHVLTDGDVIHIGDNRLRYVVDDSRTV